MAKRIKVGDLVEIPTSKGLAYAQFTLKEKQWGALLRILPGFHPERPSNFSGLVREREVFVVFFPLQAAVNRQIFEIAGNEEVPDWAKRMPVFRMAGPIDRSGKVLEWWLWENGVESRIGKLSAEQRKLPILEVWNDTLLIQRIEEGWTPETDRFSQQ